MTPRLVSVALVAACGSSPPPPAPLTSTARVDLELEGLQLYGGAGRVVAQWGTKDRCHLGVVRPPAAPAPEITYVPGAGHLQEQIAAPCGPVAITADAVYFVESGHVSRWQNGTRTHVAPLNRPYDVTLAVLGDTLYVAQSNIAEGTLTRVEPTGPRVIATLGQLTADRLLVVGDRLAVVGSATTRRLDGDTLVMLDEKQDGDRVWPLLGATRTELAWCENAKIVLRPIAGGAPSITSHACSLETRVEGDIVLDTTSGRLTRTPLAGGVAEVLATAPNGIEDVVLTRDHVFYVETIAPESTTSRLAWKTR